MLIFWVVLFDGRVTVTGILKVALVVPVSTAAARTRAFRSSWGAAAGARAPAIEDFEK